MPLHVLLHYNLWARSWWDWSACVGAGYSASSHPRHSPKLSISKPWTHARRFLRSPVWLIYRCVYMRGHVRFTHATSSANIPATTIFYILASSLLRSKDDFPWTYSCTAWVPLTNPNCFRQPCWKGNTFILRVFPTDGCWWWGYEVKETWTTSYILHWWNWR
jgi:hypothetical protein